MGQDKADAFGFNRNTKVMIYDWSKLKLLRKIFDKDLWHKKIVKFKISNNSLILLTDFRRVYYSGRIG